MSCREYYCVHTNSFREITLEARSSLRDLDAGEPAALKPRTQVWRGELGVPRLRQPRMETPASQLGRKLPLSPVEQRAAKQYGVAPSDFNLA